MGCLLRPLAGPNLVGTANPCHYRIANRLRSVVVQSPSCRPPAFVQKRRHQRLVAQRMVVAHDEHQRARPQAHHWRRPRLRTTAQGAPATVATPFSVDIKGAERATMCAAAAIRAVLATIATPDAGGASHAAAFNRRAGAGRGGGRGGISAQFLPPPHATRGGLEKDNGAGRRRRGKHVMNCPSRRFCTCRRFQCRCRRCRRCRRRRRHRRNVKSATEERRPITAAGANRQGDQEARERRQRQRWR